MTQGWTVGRRAMIGSLVVAHIWGFMLVWAVAFDGRESLVISGMFEAVGFMIFSTLAVLVGGKAWKDFAPMRWGDNVTVRETKETTVEKPNAEGA